MRYTIDTFRVDAWRAAFALADCTIVHELTDQQIDDLQFHGNDVVFAHIPRDFRLTAPVSTNPQIVRFAARIGALVVDGGDQDALPLFILYSGDGIAEDIDGRKTRCSMVLGNYPIQRIDVLEDPLHRDVAGMQLRRLINRMIQY